jgi:outer membrane protein assembly factor BamB
VGGDVQLSELMGYAGDSRLVPNANPLNSSDFLATNPDDRGLDPPKIAVEFDTRTNNTVGDPPPDYCADPSTANTDIDNKDAVQYVFWGRTSFLNIPCRDNNTLYDDNRHDADGEEPKEEWRFEGSSGALSLWRPAIGPDGTIYASDQVNSLYAFDEDGTVKWIKDLIDGNVYMPGVDPVSGTVYSDVAGNALLALNPEDGSEKWRLAIASDIDSTPIVGDKPGTPAYRTIFFGTDFVDSIFAARDNGANGEVRWQFVTGDDVNTVPALSPDGTVVYAVSNDNNLYAVNVSDNPLVDGTLKWQFPILAESGEVNSSPTVNPNDGTIYVGSDDHNVYAINPDGTQKWRFNPGTGSDIESSPTVAIDPRDSKLTVYIGSDDDNVYALDAGTGAEKWRFNTGANVISSPVVDLDGTIYVGSNDNNFYAINPDGTPKWVFATGGAVTSSPAIGQAGFIHIGSDDTNFYTISLFPGDRSGRFYTYRLG